MVQFKQTIKFFTNIIFASIILISSLPAESASADKDESSKDFVVYMVVWRGVTDAEKGFMDYFKIHKIPAKFIIKDCNNDKKKLPNILKDIKKTKPDLIYTFGTTATNFIAGTAASHTAEKNILDIPIIFNIVAKPVESGLVNIPPLGRNIDSDIFEKKILDKIDNKSDSDYIRSVYHLSSDKKNYMLRSDLSFSDNKRIFDIFMQVEYVSMLTKRNLTGCMHLVPMEAQINAMKSVLNIKKIGVLYNPSEDNAVKQVEELERFCKEYGISLVLSPIPLDAERKPVAEMLPSSVELLAEQRVSIIYLPSDSFLIANSAAVMNEINQRRIVTFSATEDPIRKSGALMGLVSRYYNVGLFAGFKAEMILMQNKNAGEIPIETLKRFSFLVNMETAQKINFYPPVLMLKFAEIISKTEEPDKKGVK